MQRMQDLPVSIDLPGVLGEEVAAFVEGEAGWQVVGSGGPLRPVLNISGRPGGNGACVVVTDGVASPEAVRSALLHGALDVVAWPADRQRLLDAPLRVRAPKRTRATACSLLRVAGAGGGAGTSTIALALGALVAWSGRRAIVIGDDDLIPLTGIDGWDGPGVPELVALAPSEAAVEAANLARPVAGVDGLSVLGGGGALARVDGWPADVVIVDARVPARLDGADLVVARPDGCLRAARGVDRPVVVVGDGALERAAARRLLQRREAAWLPRSARVARAGVAGRVPSSLPGSYLAILRSAMSGRAA